MRILGIGESVIEKIYITEGTDVPINAAPEIQVGGAVLNSMILLARLQHKCTFITTLGRDKAATIIKNKLYKEHVLLHSAFKDKTKVNTILTNPVTGRKTKLRGKVKHPILKNLEPVLIRHFDVFIIDKQYKEILDKIMKYKKPKAIIIDPSARISQITKAVTKQPINRYLDSV